MNVIELNEITYQCNRHFCCICLNTKLSEYTILKCCKQNIHINCLVEWICSKNNQSFKCPICRKDVSLSIKQGEFINIINNYNNDNEDNENLNIHIHKNDIIRIFEKYYNDLYFTKIILHEDLNINIDENGDDINGNNNSDNNIYNNRFRMIYNQIVSNYIDKILLLWMVFILILIVIFKS